MNKILLISSLLFFIISQPLSPILAASNNAAETIHSLTETATPPTSKKQLRKQKRWKNKMGKFQQKMQNKMERLKRKGKIEGSFNLGFLGLIVLLVGGLFILLGLVIPVVGVLFLVIGIIIAFAGLLALLLLGGIEVDSSH